ncbi:cytochrome P450 [Setomelanomma holmii]|uniref:Cytochrome P450 n=1 Tax=Setomelanomma holmii TaxID=210430 RepID=A0A9P4LR49_9PLEO|nr:cytochrome P450 [Setomelanomma holmii]
MRIYLASFFVGVLLHALVFSRNEWDRRSPWIFYFFASLHIIGVFILSLYCKHRFIKSLHETGVLEFVLLGGLSSSLMVYRLFFHPLGSFHGPIGARLSAFWFTKESIPDLMFYVKLRRFHDDLGDFIRIRPREPSIRHPDTIVDIHGPRNRIRKADFYEQNDPLMSLQMSRDVGFHKHQRKYWDKAFHHKALTEYTPLLLEHYKILFDIFSTHAAAGNPVNASNLLLDLFFDVVSELTFGKSFNALTEKQRNPIIQEFLQQQKVVGFMLQHMPLFYLARCLPVVQERMNAWLGWYDNALEQREKVNFYTYLSQSEHFSIHGIQEDQLAIIAGADTNAITISNACCLLCCHSEYQVKLYQELKDLPIHHGMIDDQHLAGIPILSAIIYEVLRLHPPVPGELQRLNPPEAAIIAGRFVPGDMVISTPTYAVQRDQRTFIQPHDFIPERWFTQPELILRKDAFVAFGYGAYNCAGKSLAMLQLRMVLAMIVRNFKIFVPTGRENEFQHFIDDQSDCFGIHLQPLPLLLKVRT